MLKLKLILPLALFVSVLANIYLAAGLHRYKEALTLQILTTANIEDILKLTDTNVSFVGVQELLNKKYQGEFQVVTYQEPDNIYAVSGSNAIIFNGTTLYFSKDNKYAGSSANIKSALSYWSFPWSQ